MRGELKTSIKRIIAIFGYHFQFQKDYFNADEAIDLWTP